MLLAHGQAQSSLVDSVKKAQEEDTKIHKLKHDVAEGKMPGLYMDVEGVLQFENRLCVHDVEPLKREILDEAHKSAYSLHPEATKMYQDLKQIFWWEGMKQNMANCVTMPDMPTS